MAEAGDGAAPVETTLTREEERRLVLKRKIKEAFEPFDQDSRGCCDVREIGTIIRSLDIYPSESQLRDFIVEIEEEEPTGYIRFEKFEMLMMRLLTEGDFRRDHEDKILKAFRALDPDGNGYITQDDLTTFLTTKGERFTAEEMDEMIKSASDSQTGHIYYEEYAAMLAEAANLYK